MKIVCQSCSATYKIADDKIQGKKVFKIKCKKCGEDILVRGTDAPAEQFESQAERPAEDEQTRLVSQEGGGGEAVWHAVLNGDQQGPYTVDQLRELMGQGAIDTETYVWRDGFEGWLPMRDVPELATLTVSTPESATVMSAPPPGGGDLFGAASAPAPAPTSASASELRASRVGEKARTAPKGGDLFAPEAREQEAARPLFAAEEPKAAPAGEQLTGQRNENSVLFSLATLQQLSGKETARPAGNANPDASGLIDINKLAGALNTGGAKKSSVDDIMSVGASSGLASPLAAPVLAPVAVPVAPIAAAPEPAKPQGVNKTVVVTGIAVAVILVGGIVTATLMLNRNNRDEQQQQVAMNNAPQQPAASPAAPTVPESAPTPAAPAAPAPTAAAPTAPAPAAPAPAAPEHEAPSREHRGEREHRSERPSTAAAAPTPAPAPAQAAARTAAPAPARTGTASIDDLLNRVGNAPARPAAGANTGGNTGGGNTGGGDVPETPDRGTVRSALQSVAGAVRACGTGQGGTAMVTIVFANTGRVTTANVGGIPPGPAVGCIVGAVRRASLPPFSRPTFSVTYPYPIN